MKLFRHSRIAALGIVLFALPLSASDRRFDEYQVKSVFLLNFARFVEWPAEAFQGNREQLEVCVLDRQSTAGIVDDLFAGQTVAGRRVDIRRISDIKEIAGCRVLFIRSGGAPRKQAPPRAKFLLTVGEKEADRPSGACIDFVWEHDRIRFEIDLAAAEQAGIKISSQLLNLATVVKK